MTKEKLEKEADDYADEHAFRVPYDGSNKFYDDVDFKASKEGYLAGAKPREKRIKELEQKIKIETELSKRLGVAYREYEQLTKEQDEHIVDLEKENAELKSEKGCESCTKFNEVKLTKAKEVIKSSIVLLTKSRTALDTKTYLMKAEQFLRETDIDDTIQKANEGLNLDKIADEIEQDLNESCPDILCENCTKEDCTVRKLGLVSTKESKQND